METISWNDQYGSEANIQNELQTLMEAEIREREVLSGIVQTPQRHTGWEMARKSGAKILSASLSASILWDRLWDRYPIDGYPDVYVEFSGADGHFDTLDSFSAEQQERIDYLIESVDHHSSHATAWLQCKADPTAKIACALPCGGESTVFVSFADIPWYFYRKCRVDSFEHGTHRDQINQLLEPFRNFGK